MKEFKIPSTDKVNSLHVYCWEPENKPLAIVQISHGMTEHLKRYDDFASFLAKNGILVIGNDHLGHGLTAKEEDYGYFGAKRSETVVDDLYEVTKYTKKTYCSDGENIPYILFGHSMGSFMARRFISCHGNELSGAIISGTGSQPKPVLSAGLMLAKIIGAVKGDRYKPDLLKTIAFGSYNKRFTSPKSEYAWLTRKEDIVRKYEADKMCTFDFTVNGYKTLFESIAYIQKDENIDSIPKNLPVLFISGEEDPVGNYGNGVKQVYEQYIKKGISNVKMKLYPECRHELLNEINNEEVYNDVLSFIMECK